VLEHIASKGTPPAKSARGPGVAANRE